MECSFHSCDFSGSRFAAKCGSVQSRMNQITCGGWLGYGPEQRDFVRFWMSGYYNAAGNSNILNYDRFQKNSAKVTNYCKTHKSQSLPTSIKNLGLWQ